MWALTSTKSNPDSILGSIFVIPLLGGQFGFGYVTAIRSGQYLCNIFDVVTDDPVPDDGIRNSPLLIDGYLASPMDFARSKKLPSLEPWAFCGMKMEGKVTSENRYFQIGLPPRKFDFMQLEKDVPLTNEEAASFRFLKVRFPPGSTAEIEVALKRMDVDWLEHGRRWMMGEIKQSPMTPQKQAAANVPKKKASGKTPSAKGGNLATITIPLAKKAPSKQELALRHALEDEIKKSEVGEIVSAGAGMGMMDVQVRLATKDSWKALDTALAQVGLADRATVTLES